MTQYKCSFIGDWVEENYGFAVLIDDNFLVRLGQNYVLVSYFQPKSPFFPLDEEFA